MYSRSERNTHDRARATIRERARKHFIQERKEMDHELQQNRNMLNKWINDGFAFKDVTRDENKYIVHFSNERTSDERDCCFNFESNFMQCESIWHTKSRG